MVFLGWATGGSGGTSRSDFLQWSGSQRRACAARYSGGFGDFGIGFGLVRDGMMAWYGWDGWRWTGLVWLVLLGIVWNRMAWYGLVCTGMERHGTAHTRRVTGLSVSAARWRAVVVVGTDRGKYGSTRGAE